MNNMEMETEEVIEWLNKGDVIADEESKIKFDKARAASIRSIKAWEKVIQEVSDIKYRESLNHDSFDEYSEGRYDVASHILRIINKYLNEVQSTEEIKE